MNKMIYNGAQNNLSKKIFLYLSILSWLLLTINNLASLKWLYRKNCSVWNILTKPMNFLMVIYKIANSKNQRNLENSTEQRSSINIPIQIETQTIHKIFNFFFIITFIGCVTIIYKIFIKKDQIIIDGMFGKYSKFHFIPLLFAFAMSMLGEFLNLDISDFDKLNHKEIVYTGFVISILGLGSMIFIYINTYINCNEWWVNFALNKGTFSCLIILFWYNILYNFFFVSCCITSDLDDNRIKEIKKINLATSILLGIGSIAFSYIFKDIIVCLINIFIYKDLVGKNLSLDSVENIKDVNYFADGAIDMIILISSFILLIYLIVEKVKGIIEQMNNQIIYLNIYQRQIANGINAHTQSINQIVNIINSNKKNE